MSDPKTSNSEENDDSLTGVDATIGFEPSASTSAQSGSGVAIAAKQFHDLALAAALLSSGRITERNLVRTITNWTTHGNESLAEHLVSEKAISGDLKTELEQKVAARIERIEQSLSQGARLTQQEIGQAWLSRLDRTGKLSRLLGISDESMLAVNDKQARTVGARYTLLRRLGQGGLGTVWLARDENLRRYVAVKEITQGRDDHVAMEHFRREAEITGRLEHPGIVPIHQFGTDDDTGRGFYVMRFLGRRTLHDALVEYHERRESGKEVPMMRHRLITAFVSVCQAVAHAHSRNVIHRDLKPENIALDSFGQVVLLDWGLAKIEDETGLYEVDGQAEPGDLHNVGGARAGRVLGTPLYMAPEQAAGRLDEVDHLTDIYGLGGILFAILTGMAPHAEALESSDKHAADMFSTIVSHPAKSPRELVPDVPYELDAICKKALSAKRYLRYESAAELAEDVQRFLAGTPVSAYDASVRQRVRRWMAKHPTTAQLLLLLTSLVVLGVVTTAITLRRGRAALQQARYSALAEFTRELEVNLQFDAQRLVQDVRFITELPLMQQVVSSQENVEKASPEVSPASPASIFGPTDSEEWLDHQGTLFEGLLRANPAYLVVVTCKTVDSKNIGELVRAERFATGMRSHRVPSSRLATSGATDNTEREATIWLDSLRPGEVMLMTGDQLGLDVPTRNRSPLILIAISPLFDQQTGELFGLNIIELDLRKRLEDILLAVAPEDVSVYITDAKGKVALSYSDGHFSNQLHAERVFAAEIKQLTAFFNTEDTTVDFGDDRGLYATRVQLGFRESKAEIGVILHIDGS